ncbi:hypothetical protein Y032_0207g2040 [Ancylostoma ceylanicum]|nr:hypothetical protein Y032_0207g2040 [Ancylostoma ceylanicum]
MDACDRRACDYMMKNMDQSHRSRIAVAAQTHAFAASRRLFAKNFMPHFVAVGKGELGTEMNTLIVFLTCCAIVEVYGCPRQDRDANKNTGPDPCISLYALKGMNKDGNYAFQKLNVNLKGGPWTECYELPRTVTFPGHCFALSVGSARGIGFRDGNAVAIYL